MIIPKEIQQKIIDRAFILEMKNRYKIYKDKGAPDFITEIIKTSLKFDDKRSFGDYLEDITEYTLNLKDRIDNSKEYDKTYKNKKIEIKSSSLSFNHLKKNKKVFQYNSVRLDYEYDYLLLQNIDIDTINYHIISKDKLRKIKDIWKNQKSMKNNKGKIDMINFNNIRKYTTELNSEKDLSDYIEYHKLFIN